MTSADFMRSGGLQLRQVREARQLTQLDIERATAARYGAEGRVQAQQVSRIEKGSLDKPPILDLLRIGEVLGLKPDDIAEMFGLWPRQSETPPPDPRVRELVNLVDQVPLDLREEMLTQLEVVVALTRAKLRQRLADREQDEQGEQGKRQGHDGEGGGGADDPGQGGPGSSGTHPFSGGSDSPGSSGTRRGRRKPQPRSESY